MEIQLVGSAFFYFGIKKFISGWGKKGQNEFHCCYDGSFIYNKSSRSLRCMTKGAGNWEGKFTFWAFNWQNNSEEEKKSAALLKKLISWKRENFIYILGMLIRLLDWNAERILILHLVGREGEPSRGTNVRIAVVFISAHWDNLSSYHYKKIPGMNLL